MSSKGQFNKCFIPLSIMSKGKSARAIAILKFYMAMMVVGIMMMMMMTKREILANAAK